MTRLRYLALLLVLSHGVAVGQETGVEPAYELQMPQVQPIQEAYWPYYYPPHDPVAATFDNLPGEWHWELLPHDLLFRSYLGGPKEPRMASQILHSTGAGWLWELEAGARIGIVRFGSPSGMRPEGVQLDIDGAATPRLNFARNLDLDAVDFRVGMPLTWASGPYQAKFEIYHLSSHVGDEFLLTYPSFTRINYLRDAAVLAGGYFPTPDLRLYAEAEYGFNVDGGAEPWHFQFGFDYSPLARTYWAVPAPFFATNVQLREEVDFGGAINIVGGLQWRGRRSDRLFRAGLQYYNGKSLQFQFFDQHEELLGFGIWYDF